VLAMNFLKLVFHCILIAVPVAWWLTDKWLQDFAYRINISWTVFALAGILAMLIAVFDNKFSINQSSDRKSHKKFKNRIKIDYDKSSISKVAWRISFEKQSFFLINIGGWQ
jgi:hypothetical protein